MRRIDSLKKVMMTASLVSLSAGAIARPAEAGLVTATVVTIGTDTDTSKPIGDPGVTMGRAYALLTPGIIPIPIPFNDPAGASTGTFRVITPATPVVAGSPTLGLGSTGTVALPAAGTKVIEAYAIIAGVSPFAGAQVKDPITYGPQATGTTVLESLALNAMTVQSDSTHVGYLHLDYSLGSSPTSMSTLFDLDVSANPNGNPLAVFSNISSLLSSQNASWNAASLGAQLTSALNSSSSINFNLPTFTFSLPANTTMFLGVNLEGDAGVPEPSSLVMMGTAGMVLLLTRWPRRTITRRTAGRTRAVGTP